MYVISVITGFFTLLMSTIAFAAAGPQQPVASGPFLLLLNSTASGLDANELGVTELVSYANESIFIGGVKSEIYSEPFLAIGNTSFSFTSWHEVPTGWQDMYLFPNDTRAVGFTIPHSGTVPEGATTTGYGFDGNLELNYQGIHKFIGCQDAEMAKLETYQIFYDGLDEHPAGLNCTEPLVLKQDAGCSTVG